MPNKITNNQNVVALQRNSWILPQVSQQESGFVCGLDASNFMFDGVGVGPQGGGVDLRSG